MTTDAVTLQLVSPERMLLSQEADMVVVPGQEGDFGVLPGHAPLMCALRPGLLAVYNGNDVVARFFISGGFAEVSSDKCSVLVDAADNLSDLDEASVMKELSERQDDLKLVGEDDKASAEKAVEIAQAKLDAIKSPSY